MAITNAQQYKQLVNPPMKGKKRPGYRGDDAYGGGTTAGGDRSNSPGDRGDGPATGPGALGDQGKSDYGQFVRKAKANVKIAPEIERAQARRDLPKTIAKQIALSFLPPPIRLGYTAFNLAPKPFQDKIKTAFLTGPKTTDDDNDIPTGGGDGQDNTGIMMAQAFTPYQQDIVEEKVEELSPIALALRQRDEMGGARAFAKEGGIMDLETGRQMYFLGKLVKKVTRSVKKIAKSPIGKAALGAAAIYGGKKLGLGSIAKNFFTDKALPFIKDKDNLPLLLGAGLTAAPLLFQQDDSDDEYQKFLASRGASGQSLDIQGIRNDPYSFLARPFRAEGGIMRLGFDDGDKDLSKDPNYKGWKKTYETNPDAAEMNENHKRYLNFYERNKNAQAEGSKEPVAKKTMPLLDMGGMEKDYREDGGFVPIGRMEKADDVPARLSKNEFVFTADAVRNAGDGNVDKGAEVMYNMMKNLEAGGEVSEESQGLKGARKMFQTSQRLEEVL